MVPHLRRRWYELSRQRWESEQADARRYLTDVVVGFDGDGKAYIDATFTFDTASGHCSQPFRLRVVYPDNFPERNGQPRVFLLSHRRHWQTGRDSHIEEDWRLCLYVGQDSPIRFGERGSFGLFLACVATFLVREEIYQAALVTELRTGKPAVWPGPERSHGPKGLLESIAEHGEPGSNDPCVCGSGTKYKRCCRNSIRLEKQAQFQARHSAQRGKLFAKEGR